MRRWGGDKVRQEFKSLGTDGDKVFRQLTQVITPANDNMKALSDTAKTFNGVLKQATGLVGAYMGLSGLTRAFKSIVSVNKEFESLSGSLKTVTGSAEGAKEAFAMIETFAIETPYQLDEIVEAFIRLKALGLDPSKAALTSYGNTASAFGKNILDFTDAVASAVMYNFKSLRSFGIQARVEGETVQFTFQGVTTEVAKNAKAIESYLKSIGDVNFAGAMAEQMNTMGGTMSNIEDAFDKLARSVGENGLNTALKDVLTQFNDMIGGADDAAKIIGNVLATAVQLAGKAFFALADNIEPVILLLTSRLGSSAIMAGINLLKAGVGYLQLSFANLSVSAKSAMTGIAMMTNVSKLAAMQMTLTATAAGVLKGALALVGGPAGAAVLVTAALYKLVESHDAAKKAAYDHAETLKELQDELKTTEQEAANVSAEQSKDMAVAEWSLKLKTAKQNIKDLREELQTTGGLSWSRRFSPNVLLEDYEIYAKDWANTLRQSKIDLEQYEKEIWKLAAEYPDFQPQAKEVQNRLLLLKAAEKDAWKAQQELKYLEHPELRPKDETTEPVPITPTITPISSGNSKADAYKKNIEDIRQKVLELKSPYDQAMAKAAEWRDNALKNLDETKEGYDGFKTDVENVYDGMVKKAEQTSLQSSTNWKDGLTRGMQSVYSDASDMAKSTETLVKSSFQSMEDTLVSFVMNGKASFSDLVNSVVEGMARMAIQYAVIKPLMGGIMGYMGVSIAHTGGVIGTDTLSVRTVSPDIFAGAQRFHGGGLVGGEIPIIAKQGETVFTKGQMQALGTELNSKTPVYVNVNVQNNAFGTKATATSSQDINGNVSLDIVVEQIEQTMSRNIGKGEGLSQVLEQRYALNPAYGSYR